MVPRINKTKVYILARFLYTIDSLYYKELITNLFLKIQPVNCYFSECKLTSNTKFTSFHGFLESIPELSFMGNGLSGKSSNGCDANVGVDNSSAFVVSPRNNVVPENWS